MLLVSAENVEVVGSAAFASVDDDVAAQIDDVASPDVGAVVLEVSRGGVEVDAGIVVLLASAAVVEVVGSTAVVGNDVSATVEIVSSPDVGAVVLEVSGG